MDYFEFCQNASDYIEAYLDGKGNVERTSVLKNNGVVLDAMLIRTGDSQVSPTFYFEDFYDNYEKGQPFRDVMADLIRNYEAHACKKIDMSFFMEFNRVKDRIIFKLVHAGLNGDLLKGCPHRLWNDLAIVYCYLLDSSEIGSATIIIKNEHLKMWNVSPDTIYGYAERNTPWLLPEEMLSMREVLFDMMSGLSSGNGTDECEEMGIAGNMYVLSNDSRYLGATSMLYSDCMHELSEKMGCGLYILPSSIHEVILMPESECNDETYMKQMIREVNTSEVGETEKLSDNLYYYDPENNEIRIVAV